MPKKILFALVALLISSSALAAGGVRVLPINGPINPATADYITKNLKQAVQEGDRLVMVELDTPGGLDTAMREIIKGMFASPVPVAVYVGPSGARAASAGAIITISADFAIMSPGTNIGAAHPVAMGEKMDKVMESKVTNDAVAYVEGIAAKRGRNPEVARNMVLKSISLSAEKALEAKAIDFMAATRDDAIKKLEGQVYLRDGKKSLLSLQGLPVTVHEMTTRQKILDVISNPNVAYILMMLGMLGLFFELSNPGAILPGVIGGISLILAFFAFQTLPVNYAGILLILLALVLFIAEIKVISHGMLTVGGVISMLLGSLMLFESPEPYLRVSLTVILLTVLSVAGFAAFAVVMAAKAHRLKPTTGEEGLIGEKGTAESRLAPEGKVFVRGEYWNAWSDDTIDKGDKIEVLLLEGMRVKVKKL